MKTQSIKDLIRVAAAMVACTFASVPAFAAEWYVDAVNGDDSYDGKTAQTAKKSIQAAIDSAAKNDTVKVAEGIYQDENVYEYKDSKGNPVVITSSVIITKNLTLIATGAKDKTHIVGRHADTATGTGEGAVRCVYVKEGASARIEGFTIRDGATSSGNGGGVSFSVYNKADGWLVDCVVSNCVAARGGAIQYGTAIRCFFTSNNSTSYGKIASQSILYNCIAVGNIGTDRLFNYPRAIVNCTIAGNNMNNFCYSGDAGSSHYVCNTIFLENQVAKFHNSNAVLSNCLVSSSISAFNQDASGSCATNDTGVCFIAPALGDWRPRSDSGAVGLGDAAHLSLVALPDESMRYVDYAGKPIIPVEGVITCGAIQEVVTPESGTLTLKGSFEIAGSCVADSAYCNYLHSTNYPCMYSMKAVDATISNIVWYSSTTGLPMRVPNYDGWVGVMPPPAGKMTLKPVYASKIIYADAVNGNDDYEGEDIGSWDHPYRTLQAAVDATPQGKDNNSLKYSVICAKPGDYHEGGIVESTIARRLEIVGYRRVRIVALEGPVKTVIRGCPMASSPDGVPYGCLSMNVPSLVQGFTLTGGHSKEGVDENGATAGSALTCALNVNDRVIADCIVSNNVSSFSAQRGGLSVRCVFLDNTEMRAGGGDIRSGYTVHSVFRTGIDTHNDAYALGSNTRAYFTTYKGTVHGNAVRASVLAATASCRFIDMSSDDYRLRSDSPVFGAGDADPENYWKFANLDIMGNALNFFEGCPTAGAYQQPSAIALAVDAGSGALSVGGSASLTNTVMLESSVTITKAADCGRNLIGFMLQDGTYSEGSSYTYTAPSVFSVGQVECIDAVFSTNWYVNASLGDDANDGFTPETAKRTLKGIMTSAVIAGDTVHAAPGDYAEEGMYNEKDAGPGDGEAVIQSRVVVPKGVALVSDEGADATHIVGASASEEYDVQLGLGSNAVRCVFLSDGARLKGFTLRNGRTNGNSKQEDCAFGGGVLGVGSALSFVEDCVISNCMAMYGGAGYAANFKRCRFFHNRAITRSSVTRVSYHDSCIADWNQGDRPFDYFVMMTNCTIGANQKSANGGQGYCLVYPTDSEKVLVVDCLLLGRIHSNVRMRRSAALSTSGVEAAKCEDCILTNSAALVVDADYRPVIGENAAIDVIPLTDEDASVRTEKDVYGGQRVFNGARDLGALDADWRGHYAKTLGVSRITVTEVDPAVVEKNGKIQILEGKLELAWRVPEGRQIRHTMGLTVNGSGVLSVTKNGTEYADVSEGTSGAYSFTAGGTTSMTFAYNPDADADGFAEIGGFSAPVGTVLSIR